MSARDTFDPVRGFADVFQGAVETQNSNATETQFCVFVECTSTNQVECALVPLTPSDAMVERARSAYYDNAPMPLRNGVPTRASLMAEADIKKLDALLRTILTAALAPEAT